MQELPVLQGFSDTPEVRGQTRRGGWSGYLGVVYAGANVQTQTQEHTRVET